ncbi:MAG: molybdenum ABC transporter ATP-binding protein [Pseudomonadota bacterium]
MSIQTRFSLAQGGFQLALDIELPAQGVTALFGPSGAGKTTILRVLAGLENVESARIVVGEEIWQDDSVKLPTHQRGIGYVFQESSLFAHLNVLENLQYAQQRRNADRPDSLAQAIELLGLADLLQRDTQSLSGGERKRVAIARALAASPKLLMMDEPLAGLDYQRRDEILPFIESLHNALEIPVIYVSHSADEVARIADHLILLEAGQVLGQGPISEMLTRFDLPLAHGDDAEALIEATVSAHDEEYQLTRLGFSGGEFVVPKKPLDVGTPVRLRVAARDVSVTLQPQSDTSILNIFPAMVEELTAEGEAQMTVRLSVGDTPLLARLTRKSVALLDLQVGKQVYAQAKSAAVLS